MAKYVLEGWIRAKLHYGTSTNMITDPNEYYFANHTKFNIESGDKSSRVKSFEYRDEEENIVYSIIFGYNQIGISFAVETTEEKDGISILESFLSRVVKGYNKLKKYFINEICPRTLNIEFGWQNLLICLTGFFRELNIRQQNSLLERMKSSLKKYTSNAKFVLINEELKDYSDESNKLLTMKNYEELARFDFDTIFLTIGDELYLYVDHHMFATEFFLDDLSLSINTVAKWGFISSLVLSDFYYEDREYNHDIVNLGESLTKIAKKLIPIGLDLQDEKLRKLEKTGLILENEFNEFRNLSNKIYEGIAKFEHPSKIRYILNTMDSLPHSLDMAYAVLKLSELGKFSNFKRILENLRSDLNILEIKLKKMEIYVMVVVLLTLAVGLFVGNHFAGGQLNPVISYVADILQILTFGVAIILLMIRLWPRR